MTMMPDYMLTEKELIPTRVFDHSTDASLAVAREIAALIKDKSGRGETCVLGLATGSTPTAVYAELVRMHQHESLSFQNVITFNLDEYFPMKPQELQSYHRFMNENLFDHIDINPDNIHIPDGTIDLEDVHGLCLDYENAIDEAGGIDLQILGIGRTGHIGFNEPGSSETSVTRLITLDHVTRLDAAADFFGEENVPRRAITMGVGTIMKAKRVILLAFGEGKAPVVAKAVEGEITPMIAASFLQKHTNSQFMLDKAAAAHLTRYVSPWELGPVDWTPQIIKTAVIWLANRTGKPILKLTDLDYNENNLQDLLAEHGPAYIINLEVFRMLHRTITGWPGGKPESKKRPGDLDRPGDDIFPKRILIFSPHPDDDVISMGGTLIRLVDQGHEVHVAYQVSGNIAVFDEDAVRFADFARDFAAIFGIEAEQVAKIDENIQKFLGEKQPGQVDAKEVQQIKALIRRGEARAAGRYCGIKDEHLHFMDMPFYETGRVRKEPLGDDDIQITVDLLEKVKPHQIYAAGDLSDPHGTHRTCLTAVFEACNRVRERDWYSQCEVWLYRGAWQEWEPHHIHMAVPLSPQELVRKRTAVFKHESQKDRALFPGTDKREFWQRAEDRNRSTAEIYDELGLPEFEAIEAFVRWDESTKYL